MLPSLLIMGVYAFFVVLFENYMKTKSSNIAIHSLLGVVLGLLLVFRTNTAYDRWWEGRRLWGSLVNDSRNLSLKLNTILKDDKDAKRYFAQNISEFSLSLKLHLRDESYLFAKKLSIFKTIKHKEHIPNAIASKIFHLVHDLYKKRIISGEELIILDKHISSFTNITGACERIKNTPIPYSYNFHLKQFIAIYTVTLPWGLTGSLNYFSIPAVMMVFYAFLGIELIGEEIENPFGYDSDDLPLDKICSKIQSSTYDILECEIEIIDKSTCHE